MELLGNASVNVNREIILPLFLSKCHGREPVGIYSQSFDKVATGAVYPSYPMMDPSSAVMERGGVGAPRHRQEIRAEPLSPMW